MRTLILAAALATSGCDYAYGSGNEANAETFSCTVASITDGDTFRCSETGADGKQIRIRLSGVA